MNRSEYTHGPGIDEPIAMIRNNQTYYYHADGLGSIIAITNSAGQVVQRYEYNSFGEITYQQDPNFVQPYTYTGREHDEESGLYYYRARYYDSKIGRFITQDLIGFAGGINFYSYVGNSPVNFTDPYGLVGPAAGALIGAPAGPAGAAIGAAIGFGIGVIGGMIISDYINAPPPPLKGKWICRARCNVQAIGDTCCPDRVEGFGAGPSENIACEEAKRAATQSTPSGCYPRHCKCYCSKR